MRISDAQRPIAVFDSGVGGISVLRELIYRMPGESYIYFGDSANAPYGSRSAEEVRALTDSHVSRLVQMGAKAVVIACNTATGAAIGFLREKHPTLPLIGMEPAIKPAVLAHPGGRILVMATPVTLASQKFRTLMAQYSDMAEIVPVPCRELARMIEGGMTEGAKLQAYLTETLSPYLFRPADAVVLGCTHYPFVRDAICRVVGTNSVYDGGAGTAREVQRRLGEIGLLADTERGQVTVLNSDPGGDQLQLCRRLLAGK